ncbi:UDP-glycosyltransferase 83A1 [Cardamine amara subsp. amara]|uniref:UDP-glycosyltransferase 83A1 n=1 Tax=Cardamine amara subsp. amara TaxID=228776 RepID=A0ABD1AX74_CARAN
MGRPHVLVIPYPAQGHVLPLMSFSHYLAKQGIQITFINTEFNHNRIINSLSKSSYQDYVGHWINLVSIPDGLEDSPEERNIPGKLSESVLRFIPNKVEQLIERMIAESSGTIISCVVADQSLGWAIEVAAKFGISRAAFCPAAAASMVLGFSIQKLIDDGLIDSEGSPRVNKTIQLSPGMPKMETEKFVWVCLKNKESQKNIFQLMLQNNKSIESTDWLLCNSVYELETAAFGLGSQILPIGPIAWAHSLKEESTSLGSFLPQDRDCLDWLDRQISGSVIYVAFGSFGVMGNAQLEELAIGLELTKRPVLWVTGSWDQRKPPIKLGSDQVKVVRWAPQREVLSYGAIGCFVSHCGWNSTLEGAQNGIPFLCMPYFADQFINKAYICDVWKIGLEFERDERGVVPGLEVKKKIDEIMRDDGNYKKRAMKVKDIVMKSVAKDGISYENLNKFVNWIKSQVN